jgi:hypothetical protein
LKGICLCLKLQFTSLLSFQISVHISFIFPNFSSRLFYLPKFQFTSLLSFQISVHISFIFPNFSSHLFIFPNFSSHLFYLSKFQFTSLLSFQISVHISFILPNLLNTLGGIRCRLSQINILYNYEWGHTVAQLVVALRYKSEGRGFDSRWSYWNFLLT